MYVDGHEPRHLGQGRCGVTRERVRRGVDDSGGESRKRAGRDAHHSRPVVQGVSGGGRVASITGAASFTWSTGVTGPNRSTRVTSAIALRTVYVCPGPSIAGGRSGRRYGIRVA